VPLEALRAEAIRRLDDWVRDDPSGREELREYQERSEEVQRLASTSHRVTSRSLWRLYSPERPVAMLPYALHEIAHSVVPVGDEVLMGVLCRSRALWTRGVGFRGNRTIPGVAADLIVADLMDVLGQEWQRLAGRGQHRAE
jgi:hypothetical protein